MKRSKRKKKEDTKEKINLDWSLQSCNQVLNINKVTQL
jgi:hypothetical protein